MTTDSDSARDTVTVQESGSVTIGGTTYANASSKDSMDIEITADGNKLTRGSVNLDSGESIKVGSGSTVVKNTGGGGKAITVTAATTSGGNSTATIPEGGSAKIGNATVSTSGGIEVSIGDDGNSSLTIGKGKSVTVNGVTYTNDDTEAGIRITWDGNGKITGVSGTPSIIITESVESYTLLPGQSVKINGYIYTAPTTEQGGQTGDVVLENRDSGQNPEVTLTRNAAKVEVSSVVTPSDTKEYTAESANTKFAMTVVVDDTTPADTTKITLLSNGTDAESRMTVPKGTTVTGGSNTITVTSDSAEIVMAGTETKNAMLVSGAGSSTGRMSATVEDIDRTFSSTNGGYTVDTTAKTLTLNSGSSTEPAKVVMDSVTLTGTSDDVFPIGKNDDGDTTVGVPGGTSISSGSNTIKGVAEESVAQTKVEIDKNTGDLTLIGGKGQVTGPTTVYARVTSEGETKNVKVEVPSGTTCIIDLNAGTPSVTSVDTNEQVTIGGVTYKSNADNGSFPLNGSTGVLTNDGDSATIPGEITGDVEITLGTGTASVVTIPGTNMEDVTLIKGSTNTITLAAGDKFKVGEQEYTAPTGGATYTISSEGGVAEVKRLTENETYTLEPGNSVTIGRYTYTVPGGGSSVTLTGRESGEPAVTLGSSGDSVTVALISTPAVNTVYTAAAGTTRFAMSAGDTDTKDIDLLSNGTTSESRLTVVGGVTVSGGGNTITAVDSGAQVEMSGGKAVLISGEGSSSGSMTATINGTNLDFTGSTKYTVNTSAETPTLTLNDGTSQIPASVTMGGVTFTGVGNSTFTLGKTDDSTDPKITAVIPDGARVTDKSNVTVQGVSPGSGEDATKVEIDKDWNLVLVGGKGAVTGEATVKVEVDDSTAEDKKRSVSVTIPSSETYIIDTDGEKVTGIGSGKTVTIGDVTYTSGQDGGEFPLDGTNGRLTNVGDEAEVPAGTAATISLGTDSDLEISIPGGDDSKNGQMTVRKTSDGAEVTVAKAGDSFTVGGKTYTAPCDGAAYYIGASGEVRAVFPDSVWKDAGFSYELQPGEAVTVGKYTYTAPSSGTKADVKISSRVDDNGNALNPAVTLKEADGTVEVALTSSPGTKTTYTAGSASTKFSMSSGDEDTKNIDLLEDGSQVKNATGATVSGGGNTITAGNTDALIVMSEGKAVLISGKGSSSGSMTASIDKTNRNFTGSTKYTVDISAKTLTLNSGTSESPASVKMGNVTFKGDSGDVFTLGKTSDGSRTTVEIQAGAVVTGKNGASIEGVSPGTDATKVEIDGNENLVLVNGKGTVTGDATVYAKITGSEDPQTIHVPSGTTCTIDLDSNPQQVTDLGSGESVTVGGITYTGVGTDPDGSSFPLDNSEGRLTENDEKAVVSAGNSASITIGSGGSPVITVPSDDAATTGAVEITKTDSGADVKLSKTGDSFKVGGKTYSAGSDDAVFAVRTDGSVTLTSGSASLADGDSIVGKSGKVIENPVNSETDTITVEVGSDGKDTVTVPSSEGKVKIGGIEYETAENTTKIDVTSGANKVTQGSVKIDEDGSISVGNGNTVVRNTGDQNIPIAVKAGTADGAGQVTIPQGGEVKIGEKTEIGSRSGQVTVDINADGIPTITIPRSGSVTINGIIYSDNRRADVTGDPYTVTLDKNGNVTEITGIPSVEIPQGKLPEAGYPLLPGQSVTVGNYIYTAPSDVGAAQGDVVLKGPVEDGNPQVVLSKVKTAVDVALRTTPTEKTAYTAQNANTCFRMSEAANAKSITLLDNGTSGANSELTTVEGATVAAGTRTVTAGSGGASVALNSDKEIELVAGTGSTTGKMVATIDDLGKMTFNGSVGYTVDASAKTLTLNGGTSQSPASVKMGEVNFTGESGKNFALDKSESGDSEITAVIPAGASVTDKKGVTVQGVSPGTDATKVEIDKDWNLVLVDGKGTVSGETTVYAKITGSGGETRTIEIGVPTGTTCTIDLDSTPQKVTGLGDDESVRIGGITYSGVTADGEDSSFPLDNSGSDLVNEGERAEVSPGTGTTITIGTVEGAPEVQIPGKDQEKNTGNVIVEKTSDGADITVVNAGDTFSVGDTVYEAPTNRAEYTVDGEGNVTSKIPDSSWDVAGFEYELKSGRSVTVGKYTYTVPTGASKVVLKARGSGLTPEVVLSNGGTIEVSLKDYPSTKTRYGAGEAGTDFAMFSSDSDTTKIDLLGGRIGTSGGDGSKSITVSVGVGGEDVKVVIPSDNRAMVGTDSVTGVASGQSVTIGGVTFTSAKSGGSFPIEGANAGSLLNTGDSAMVPGTMTSDAVIAIGSGGDAPRVTVPGATVGDVLVVKTATGASVTLGKTGDSFSVGDQVYTAGSDGAVFIIGGDGGVSMTGGSASLGDGQSVIGTSGKTIVNPEGSINDTVIVEVGSDGRDTVTIPTSGGKVVIGGTEYETSSDGTVITVSGDSDKLTSGSVVLDRDEKITVGSKDTLVENRGDKQIAVASGEDEDTATIPAGGKARIGNVEIGGLSGDITIVIGSDGNLAVTLTKGQAMSVNGKTYSGVDSEGIELKIDSNGNVSGFEAKVTVSGTEEIDSDIELPETNPVVGEEITLPEKDVNGDPIVSKDGRILVGWDVSAGSETKEYCIGSKYAVESDSVTVEAKWVSADQVIVYANQGDAVIEGKPYDELSSGGVIELRDGSGVQTSSSDVVFAGWTPADGGNKDVVYAPSTKLTTSPTTTYMNAYYITKDEASNLIYDAGDGTGTVGDQWVRTGDVVWLPTALDMHRQGYKFVGWATESKTDNEPVTTTGADRYGRTMIDTAYYKVNEDETIYAVWESTSFGPIFIEDDDDPVVIIPDDEKDGWGARKTIEVLLIIVAAIAVIELTILIAHRRR